MYLSDDPVYRGRGVFAFATGAVLPVLVSVVLSGCSGNTVDAAATDEPVAQARAEVQEPSSPSVDEDDNPDPPSEEDVEAYFEAASTYSVIGLDRAVDLTQTDSVAEAYATYLRGYANASLDGGVPLSGSLAVRTDDGYESCSSAGCVTWRNIRGRHGRIGAFSVNRESLEGRIAVVDGAEVSAGELAEVTVLSVYRSVTSGDLDVVAEVSSHDASIRLGLYQATYLSPGGRDLMSTSFVGPSRLPPRSMATVVMSFPDAEIGGTVTLPVFNHKYVRERYAVLPTG